MNRTALATITGLVLGVALVFGNFGDMLIVALFGAIGYGAARVLAGDVDAQAWWLSRSRRAADDRRSRGPAATVAETRPATLAGRTELGRITVADSVVTKIAAQAAAENPDAGAAAARVLGRAVPGAGHLGVRGTDLDALPKTTVQVDGSKAYVSLEIAVRWTASVAEVTGQVRRHVRDRVRELAGLEVDEVHIVVAGLATDITPPPRVR